MKISLQLRNSIIALIFALISLGAVLTFYAYFVYPISQYQSDKFLQECELHGMTCTVEPNFVVPLISAIIPFMIYVLVFKILDNKTKTDNIWRSYR